MGERHRSAAAPHRPADTLDEGGCATRAFAGLGRLNVSTTVLQRAGLANPLGGMWEAADLQWWWRRPRTTDDLELPVWFDEVGPVAAAGLTAWGDTWQQTSSPCRRPSTRKTSGPRRWKPPPDLAARHSRCSCARTTAAGGPRHPEWIHLDRRVVGHRMDGGRTAPAGRSGRWVCDRRSRVKRAIVRTR